MPKDTFKQLPDEKRERITAAAATLFAERGFAATDVAQIAKQAGVAKGSLYNYFESKEDLYFFVCRDGLERSRRAVYGGIEPEWDVYRQIEYIFRQGAQFARAHPEYIQLYLAVSSAGMDRFARDLSLEVEKYTADHLKKLIGDSIRQGVVRPDIDVNLTAFLINSLYIMFVISLVSSHFRIRMQEYLAIQGELTDAAVNEPLDRVIELIHSFLRPLEAPPS
jgi:TetR/AcrR family transcriptional regulator